MLNLNLIFLLDMGIPYLPEAYFKAIMGGKWEEFPKF